MASRVISHLRRSPYAFLLAALAALAMFFISETSYQRASRSLDNLGAISASRYAIQRLLRDLTDAETGQRGYLLTGRQEYLQPYTESLGSIASGLNELTRYYAADDAGAPLMERVRTLTGEKLSELETTLKLYDEGRGDRWREVLLTNIGKEKMEGVRRALEQLAQREADKVVVGREGVYQTLLLNRVGVTAMTALSLLALFMYLRQTAALLKQRETLAAAIETERDQLDVEVTRRTVLLTELAQHLQTVREDERSHLARELHDELGALLTAAKLDVARLKSRLGATTPEVGERLSHLNEALNSGIALKRRIIEDLRPSSLSNLGLVAALDILLQEFSARSGVQVTSELEAVKLTESGELTTYRLIQEALTNVAKYASATAVHVTVVARGGNVQVQVRDDGVGFDTDRPTVAAHGLVGMRYRVEAEGGRMTLKSAPGAGTTIEAQLPEAQPASAEPGPSPTDTLRLSDNASATGLIDAVR